MGDPTYFDTSALAKLVLQEPESEDLERYIADSSHQAVGSQICEVELIRAVLRLDPLLLDSALEVLAQTVLLPMSTPIRLRASYLKPETVRSLDAIHVATALEIQTELDGFLTYDLRMAEAGIEAGLRVMSPGQG